MESCEHSRGALDLCISDVDTVPRRGLLRLLRDQRHCDVTFLVDDQPFPAHRVIVAAQSEFFDRLLYGSMKESQCKEISLKDIPSGAFQILLEYMYGGSVGKVDIQTTLDLLGLADRFDFQDLKQGLEKHLCYITDVTTVLHFLYYAEAFNASHLHQRCVNFVDSNAKALLASDAIVALPQQQLISLISRDTLLVDEMSVFKAVQRWKVHNGKTAKETASLLKCVRLSEISSHELVAVVQPSGLYGEGEVSTALLDLAQHRAKAEHMSPRGKKGLNLFRDSTTVLLSHNNYSLEYSKSSEQHANTAVNLTFLLNSRASIEHSSIVFEFDGVYLINELKLTGCSASGETEPFSYVVDVSRDCETWLTAVDHSGFRCYGTQSLYFPKQAAKYIRLTQKKGRDMFTLRLLSCSSASSVPFVFADGILGPTVHMTPDYSQHFRNDGSDVRCFLFFHQPYSISLLRFTMCGLDEYTGHVRIAVASKNRARAYTTISAPRHHAFEYEICATFPEQLVCIVSVTLTNLHLKKVLQPLKDVQFTVEQLYIGRC